MSLNELHDALLDIPGNSLTNALFILVDHMVDAGEDNVFESYGNIGICLNNKVIEIVDIEASRSIAQFTFTNDKIII